ncbi:MAG: amidohydrolase family protein, partial [Phycisphaerales bacterium]|nr:amidohydrolase family protein [Phycisphaerales bacterium]
MALLIRNARAVTMSGGPIPRRGRSLGELGVIERADVLVVGEHIEAVEPTGRIRAPEGAEEIDADGRVVMPAFVDCHTHACWAGDRLDEWDRKRGGATYLEILRSGGGIMSTVRAVREATEPALTTSLVRRLRAMLREGTTTVEVKSGYGLTSEDELKMLRAIRGAGAEWPGTIVRTALLGHAIDAGQKNFVRRTIEETLPAVREAFGDLTIDAYCEQGAWSLEDCEALFREALSAGHHVRVHADQFNELGMVDWAVGMGPAAVLSVDHLEATGKPALKRLASSGGFGVALPCAGVHTDGGSMGRRGAVEAGGARGPA